MGNHDSVAPSAPMPSPGPEYRCKHCGQPIMRLEGWAHYFEVPGQPARAGGSGPFVIDHDPEPPSVTLEGVLDD